MKYPSGTKYWKVKCRLPDGKYYQRKHKSKDEAIRDRLRLIRELGGGGSSPDQFRALEVAQYRLTNCLGDARGLNIADAVEFVISAYKDPTKTPIVREAVSLFEDEHVKGLRPDSQDEYDRYLRKFVARFGEFRLAQINTKVLQDYINSLSAKVNRHKCLSGLMSFCSGGSEKIKSPHKWLTENPAKHVLLPKKKKDMEIVIYTPDEIRSALAVALMIGDLPYWVWGFFTGMRPCEIRKFWTWKGYGWRKVFLDRGYIEVNSEIAKDKRRRKIFIRPNLRAWIEYFLATEEQMYPTCHRIKFREVKKAAVAPDKYLVKDVIRHTFISYRVHAFDKSIGVTAMESGNSERIIREHYFDLITGEGAIEAFWNLTPASFGLIAPHSSSSNESEEEAVEDIDGAA